MRIVIVNYRYFLSGGPERYLFNIKEMLEELGHEVIPFSVKHNKNVVSSYSEYFSSPIGSGEEIYGHEYKKDFGTILKASSRMIYSFEVKRKFKLLIKNVKPDLVYILQYQNKLSCSVVDAAYECGIPIVQRISDFAHICIDNIFYHYQSKTICEHCLKGSRIEAIRKKCANDSYINSVLKVAALKVQDIRKTREKISRYIIPALFTAKKFQEYGIPSEKIHHIPTFFKVAEEEDNKEVSYDQYFLYIGRIDPDKGLKTLVDAFVNTPYRLIIVGFSMEGYDSYLKDYLIGKKHNIVFTGKLDFSQIQFYLKTCLCTIVPSEWYDNMPNVVLESYAFSKAVLASNIGSLKDLIEENETGLHFEPGQSDSLLKTVTYAYENKSEIERMGRNGELRIRTKYSSDYHLRALLNVFHDVLNDRG